MSQPISYVVGRPESMIQGSCMNDEDQLEVATGAIFANVALNRASKDGVLTVVG
jgi:hypothetical protein